MKIKRVRNKKVLVIAAVAIIIAASVLAYIMLKPKSTTSADAVSSQSSTDLSPATDSEKAAGDQAKTSTVNPDTATDTPTPDKGNDTPTSKVPSVINVEVTSSSQDKEAGVYQLRALIQYAVSTGTCKLVLTQGSKSVTKTASTQALAQSSTCQGFDVPVSELGTGTWNYGLTVTGTGYTGGTSGTINIE